MRHPYERKEKQNGRMDQGRMQNQKTRIWALPLPSCVCSWGK